MFPARCEMLDEFRFCFESSNILLMYQIKCFALEDVIFKITCPSIFHSDISNAELRSLEAPNWNPLMLKLTVISRIGKNISSRSIFILSIIICVV